MIKPFRFLFLTVCFTAAIIAVAQYVPPGDPFTIKTNNKLVSLDGISLPVFAEFKIRHVKSQPRFDVGLFGNSRSLNVGIDDLSLSDCKFFNFSVGSESFRFSVANLERLHAMGKAPKLALISIDHFELQHYTNPISFFAPTRWKSAFEDIKAGFTHDEIRFLELFRMVWRHVWVEIVRFKMTFTPETFFKGISHLLSGSSTFSLVSPLSVGYQSDGSRQSPLPTNKKELQILIPTVRQQIDTGYFKYDMERLAKLQKDGIKVVIYESPLEPKSGLFFYNQPTSQASKSRSTFARACARMGLYCYPADPKRFSSNEDSWADQSHPPSSLLSLLLNDLIDESQLACRR